MLWCVCTCTRIPLWELYNYFFKIHPRLKDLIGYYLPRGSLQVIQTAWSQYVRLQVVSFFFFISSEMPGIICSLLFVIRKQQWKTVFLNYYFYFIFQSYKKIIRRYLRGGRIIMFANRKSNKEKFLLLFSYNDF